MDNAEKEVYFETTYYDPHVSSKVFEKIGKGVTIHILDGNPEQITVENRLAAIIRTPPNGETAELVKKIIKSPRFDLKRLPKLPKASWWWMGSRWYMVLSISTTQNSSKLPSQSMTMLTWRSDS